VFCLLKNERLRLKQLNVNKMRPSLTFLLRNWCMKLHILR